MDDHAVQIVELRNNKYRLNLKELEKILSRKDLAGKKVAIISTAGACRKGKSFLLSMIVIFLEWLTNGGTGTWFDEQTVVDKFHFRDGCESDTNGIYLWSKPFVLKRGGKEVVVLLMDTQGAFDHNSTVQDCATIFALSTLLSSLQIYNISTLIQEDNLTNLGFFTQYAKLVEKGTNQAPFQRLLFLVRDWTNVKDYRYGYEGGKKYLRWIMTVSNYKELTVGFKKSQNQKQELRTLRDNIGSSFDSLDCFLMPHPGLRITQNKSGEPLGHVEQDFKEQLALFVPSLIGEEDDSMEVKAINGVEITCSELIELIKASVKAFNSDDNPAPKSILEATAEAIDMAAEQKSKKTYDEFMASKIPENSHLTDFTILDGIQKQAEAAAMEVFAARPKFGSQGDSIGGHIENLKEYFKTGFNQFKRQVEKNVEEEKRKKQWEKKAAELEKKEQQFEAKRQQEDMKEKKQEEAEARRRKEEEDKEDKKMAYKSAKQTKKTINTVAKATTTSVIAVLKAWKE